jgi:hypothetical protein
MTLERHLALAETLAARLAGGHQERAQAVIEALAVLRAYCTDVATRRAVAIAWALCSELHDRALRPTDAEIAAAVRELGVRGAGRALNVPRQTVSRIAARVRGVSHGTSMPLSLPTEPRTVGPGVMERESGSGAGLLVHHAAPADPQKIGAHRMLGNGSKRPEIVSPQAAIATLFARLERLEQLPANAEEAAKFEGERLQIRRRLAEERFALIDALEREGVAIAKRVAKALYALEWAAGPKARAAADEALRAVLLEQQSNSCAQELRPAALVKELVRTADAAWKEAQAQFEREMEANRAYFPPFIPTTDADKAKMRAAARAAPQDPDLTKALRNGDTAASRRFGQNIITIPFINGGFDQSVLHLQRQRGAALKAAHLYCREEGPLLPITHAEVLEAIAQLKASIPPVPGGSSLGMFPVEGIESRPEPVTVEEHAYVDGVPQ